MGNAYKRNSLMSEVSLNLRLPKAVAADLMKKADDKECSISNLVERRLENITMSFRLPHEVVEGLRRRAAEEDRSMNSVLCRMLKQAMDIGTAAAT